MPFHVHDPVREPFFAIVPVFNPFRFKSRWKHAERAIKHFAESGATVILVEAAFNRRELAFANSGLDGTPSSCPVLANDSKYNHKYIGLHTKSEAWIKECLVHVGVQNLPHTWEQCGWFDADIRFQNPSWVGRTIHELQHTDFVQPFTEARDVGPNYEMLPETHPHAAGPSFIAAWQEGKFSQLKNDGYYYSGNSAGKVWPGLAMACTHRAWDVTGGIPDYHIWSGADWVMGHALIGKRDSMLRNDLHPNYIALADAWYDTCQRHIRKNVGTVSGTAFHFFHGPKESRAYNKKHALLAAIGFDPLRHLKRDSNGLWCLNDLGEDSFIELRDTMRRISRERNEDSTEVGLGK